MVLDKVRTDGLLPTIETVRNKLDQPLPMGYCNVGEVVAVGTGVAGFAVGDRVASNGRHAEMVAVPVNLCAQVPDAVSDDGAVFTVLGAIALQGIRLVQPTLGEVVVVTGLGLIGLLTVQLLKAQGCRVLGLDFDPAKLELARRFGAEVVDLQAGADPVGAALLASRGRGVDAVIVTASTKSSEPIHQAALMCRKRGRIVLVGVTGLDLSRADFYEKELTFQVSCSYGPGRYDSNYEEKGQDYPVGFVRWTEQRNFEAILDMLAEGHLVVEPLISHRFNVDQASAAYAVVAGSEPSLGIILKFSDLSTEVKTRARTVPLVLNKPTHCSSMRNDVVRVSVVGAGNYAGAVLIPAFKAAGAQLVRIASQGGVSSLHVGRKFGFEAATTDSSALLEDSLINAVIVSTRHDTHAEFVLRALSAGKHVFVEKPLAIRLEDLDKIAIAARSTNKLVMVGFNRRFAPQVRKIQDLLTGVPGPKTFVMTVNAGAIPGNHWTQNPEVGGGRLVGEACHFIDLLRFLAGTSICKYLVLPMRTESKDSFTITLQFSCGSLGTIIYLGNGSKAFPKERLEIFASGRVLQLDNFRRMRGYGWPGFKSMNLWSQDKGQMACALAFCDALRRGGHSPIPMDELLDVGRVSIELAQVVS
jgi:predicted dehydrogenase/threonine dehydrogenase-like Zn-dependent dehydrogenase